MSLYNFITDWKFNAPVENVWKEIHSMDTWPEWWKYVKSVRLVRAGDQDDLQSIRRITWSTALPYTITFDSELIFLKPYERIEGNVYGELTGTGTWIFFYENNHTHVRYEWRVETTKKWMNLLEPIARPLFKWNHDKVMQAGYEGLQKRLNVISKPH